MERTVIERGVGYEEVLDALVTRITGIEHFKHHTGCSFSNEVFELRPYYFGKCACRYGWEFNEFLKTNPHKPDCFHVELELLNDAFKKHPQYNNVNKLKAERANEERRLCIAHNINYKDGRNLEDLCNCGVLQAFETKQIAHEDSCPKNKPNFWFKPENIKISWYKTYFRDASSTVALTLEDLRRIVGVCLSSI